MGFQVGMALWEKIAGQIICIDNGTAAVHIMQSGLLILSRRGLGFPKLGVPFWGAYNQDYCGMLGSILESPYFGKLPLKCGRATLGQN